MHRIRIIIADPDGRYVDKVTEYINSSHSSQVRVSSFTRFELLETYLSSSGEQIDILAVHSTFLNRFPESPAGVKLIVELSDSTIANRDKRYRSLSKFQPGDRIVEQMLNFFFEDNDVLPGNETGSASTKLISVYSAAGGAGKTSLAFGLSVQLGMKGCAVLYLSFESICSAAATLSHSCNDGFTHVLLCLKEDPDLLPAKIGTYKIRDNSYGIEYLAPPDCFMELVELTKNDLTLILEKLKGMSSYDFVIIDMDSKADDKTLAVLESSDAVIFLTTSDRMSAYKSEVFLQQLRRTEPAILKKLVPVLNKYCGSNDLNHCIGSESIIIPAVPDLWAFDDEGKGIFQMDNAFTEGILRLAQTIRDG